MSASQLKAGRLLRLWPFSWKGFRYRDYFGAAEEVKLLDRQSAVHVNNASARSMTADGPGSMIKLMTCADDLSAPAAPRRPAGSLSR
jgi:hypothetical protein